jgi:hypothetical protein
VTTARGVWRDQPGALLVSYLALAWLPGVLRLEQFDSPIRAFLGFAVLTFLTWRIWRGGSVSWVLLTVLTVLDLADTVLGAAAPLAVPVYLPIAFTAMQLAILLSPAVRHRSAQTRGQRSE